MGQRKTLATITAVIAIVTFVLLDGPQILRTLFGNSHPQPSTTENTPSETLSQPRIEIRRDRHLLMPTDYEIWCIDGSSEYKLFETYSANPSELEMSPDHTRVVYLSRSTIHVSNTDSTYAHVWTLQGGRNRSDFWRDANGLVFLDNDTIRFFLEIEDDYDFWYGNFRLSGRGTYDVSFDDLNYISSVKRVP